jgi:single-strand DNA-binding protein
MSSLNKAMLIGNLGQAPKMKEFEDGGCVVNISIATSSKWKDKQTGEQKEKTEWHNVVFRDKLARTVEQYVKKGDKIYVEGRIEKRKYEKDGVERESFEIHADRMQMLGGNRDVVPSANYANKDTAAVNGGMVDDDIPF